MTPATRPRSRSTVTRLLVVDERGAVSHHDRRTLPRLLRSGDLVVANDAATLPASLSGIHVRSGAAIEVRLAGRSTLSPALVKRFTAVVFGAGDYRMATEQRALPPVLHEGDELLIASLRARVLETRGHPRVIEIEFDHSPAQVWEGLARHGRPIQYAYVPLPLAICDTWTSIAAHPVAYEAPSAGFVLDWSMLHELRARQIGFATLTHAAGISSTGDPELDARLPFDEPYAIPASTAALIATTKSSGGRIIAVGTTVVRALEHAARETGDVLAGAGIATDRIGPTTPLRVVDGIVSGMHEPGTSHYELLQALQSAAAIARMSDEAEAHEYRAHEFGDAVLIMGRDAGCSADDVDCVWRPPISAADPCGTPSGSTSIRSAPA